VRSDLYLLLCLLSEQFSQVTPLFSKQPVPPPTHPINSNVSASTSIPANRVLATPSPLPAVTTADLSMMRPLSPQEPNENIQQESPLPRSPVPPLAASPTITTNRVPQTEQDGELENCCPICLETIKEIKQNNKRIMTTICGHIICSDCTESLCSKISIECPKCRRQLTKDQIHIIFL